MTDCVTDRRSRERVLYAAILWMFSYFLARYALRDATLANEWRIAAALLPVAPFAWFLWAFVTSIRSLDELQRRIHLEALAIAFPLVMLILMTLGLLQLAIRLPAADLSFNHVWGWLPLVYFGSLAWTRGRYA